MKNMAHEDKHWLKEAEKREKTLSKKLALRHKKVWDKR